MTKSNWRLSFKTILIPTAMWTIVRHEGAERSGLSDSLTAAMLHKR